MLNVQLKSTILSLKKQNGEDYKMQLQNVKLQETGLGPEGKNNLHIYFCRH